MGESVGTEKEKGWQRMDASNNWNMRWAVGWYALVFSALIGLVVGAAGAADPNDFFALPESRPAVPGMFGGAQPVGSASAEFTHDAATRRGHLFVTLKLEPGWHVYSLTQPAGGPLPTQIELNKSTEFRLLDGFRPDQAPERKKEPLFDNIIVESHEGEVTWYAPIELAEGVTAEQVRIVGKVIAQPCDANSCLPPQDFAFTARVGQGRPLPAMPAKASSAASIVWSDLLIALVSAFIGGVILNVMPCVLPVISLKLMSFVQQAGESRTRIFLLNLWYTAGVLTVFFLLAALAAGASLAWGEQFTLAWFKVALTALVFAMALSFLGVWEIPLPGFAGSGKAGELQAKEGPSGAFFKGVFATILATPCSGPFLGPVFAFLMSQPPLVIYLVFGAMGLGMASPYLVIGLFPSLIRAIPRPGVWMEMFKNLMGFVLLGTVVYLFSTLMPNYVVPTLTLLTGIGFACWLVGRTPLTVGPQKRAAAWLGGLAVAALSGMIGFVVLLQNPKIPWQPFTPQALAAARAEGKTVMVDFTANWCLTCKWNLKFAIDRPRVRELLERNRVVPMLADWTDRSEMIKEQLNALGKNSIPLLVVWPPKGEPIIKSDLLTEAQVVEALTAAGPSRSAAPASAAAPVPPSLGHSRWPSADASQSLPRPQVR